MSNVAADPRRPAGEPLGAAEQQVQHGAVGNANQNQCDQTSSFSHALKLPGVPRARCRRRVGVTPAAEQPVGLHGVGNLHALGRAPRGRRRASCTRPHRPTSAAGTSRHHARARARWHEHAQRTGRPRRRRARAEASDGAAWRTSGAATPATSTVTAPRGRAVERRTQASVVRRRAAGPIRRLQGCAPWRPSSSSAAAASCASRSTGRTR